MLLASTDGRFDVLGYCGWLEIDGASSLSDYSPPPSSHALLSTIDKHHHQKVLIYAKMAPQFCHLYDSCYVPRYVKTKHTIIQKIA